MCTGNLGGGGGGAEAPFTVKMSPLFGENALRAIGQRSENLKSAIAIEWRSDSETCDAADLLEAPKPRKVIEVAQMWQKSDFRSLLRRNPKRNPKVTF